MEDTPTERRIAWFIVGIIILGLAGVAWRNASKYDTPLPDVPIQSTDEPSYPIPAGATDVKG